MKSSWLSNGKSHFLLFFYESIQSTHSFQEHGNLLQFTSIPLSLHPLSSRNVFNMHSSYELKTKVKMIIKKRWWCEIQKLMVKIMITRLEFCSWIPNTAINSPPSLSCTSFPCHNWASHLSFCPFSFSPHLAIQQTRCWLVQSLPSAHYHHPLLRKTRRSINYWGQLLS